MCPENHLPLPSNHSAFASSTASSAFNAGHNPFVSPAAPPGGPHAAAPPGAGGIHHHQPGQPGGGLYSPFNGFASAAAPGRSPITPTSSIAPTRLIRFTENALNLFKLP